MGSEMCIRDSRSTETRDCSPYDKCHRIWGDGRDDGADFEDGKRDAVHPLDVIERIQATTGWQQCHLRDQIGRAIPPDIVEAVEVAGDVGYRRCFV